MPYVLEEDLEDVLRFFKIDERVNGDEYASNKFTGRHYCYENGFEHYQKGKTKLKKA